MLIKAFNLYALVAVCFLATSVHSTIAGCDPFPSTLYYTGSPFFNYDVRSTCDLSYINWNSTAQNGLEITAYLDNCLDAPADGESAASYFISVAPYGGVLPVSANQYDLAVSTDNLYYFSYWLMWPKSDSKCLADLIGLTADGAFVSINMVDQSGYRNIPTEDLRDAATNQWYGRSFKINGTSLVGMTSLRFGFSCSGTVADNNQRTQRAYVDNVRLITVGKKGYTIDYKILYSSKVNCTGCLIRPPRELIDYAYCDETLPRWMVNTTLNVTRFEWDTYFTLNGDVYSDIIVMSNSIALTGCIHPFTQGQLVAFGLARGYALDVYMGVNCTIDQWDTSSSRITLLEPGHALIGDKRACVYDPINEPDVSGENCVPTDPPPFFSGQVIAIIVVVPVVVTGVIVGIVFGVKKYRENQRGRELDERMQNADLD